MAAHLDQLDHFNTYMSHRRKIDISWLSIYPVHEATQGLTDPQRPLYVNVGGGIGHQCAQFREKYPNIPGRVILQDLPVTVERALPIPGVENMAHDFFEPQPIKGMKTPVQQPSRFFKFPLMFLKQYLLYSMLTAMYDNRCQILLHAWSASQPPTSQGEEAFREYQECHGRGLDSVG